MTAQNRTLKCYQSVEDAWEDGLADWCARHAGAILDGEDAILVVADRSQGAWVRRRLLSAGIHLCGLRILEPWGLRRELCRILGVQSHALGTEALQLLLTSMAVDGKGAGAVRQSPAQCLRALDDLGFAAITGKSSPREILGDGGAGGGEDLVSQLPEAAWRFLEDLDGRGIWTPEIDGEIARAVEGLPAPVPMSVCVFGLGPGHWRERELLLSGARASREALVLCPLPGLQSESLDAEWIESIETGLGIERVDCEHSGFESGGDWLVNRLAGAEVGEALDHPRFLVGLDWRAQVDVIRNEVVEWLAEEGERPPDGRLAIVVPGESATPLALASALEEAGIPFRNDTGGGAGAPVSVRLQLAVLEFQREEGAVEPFLQIVRILSEMGMEGELCPRPDRARKILLKAFGRLQTRSVGRLVGGFDDARDADRRMLFRLYEAVHAGRETGTWEGLKGEWTRCLEFLRVDENPVETVWRRMDDLLQGRRVRAADFHAFIESVLAGERLPADREGGREAFARVVITNLPGAGGQLWDKVVFTDCVEGAWPAVAGANPFLGDDRRDDLNARFRSRGSDARLLTTVDRLRIESSRFMGLLENTRRPPVFCAFTGDSKEPGTGEWSPNEWAQRCLLESRLAGGTGMDEPIDPFFEAGSAPGGGDLPDEESDRLVTAHQSRRDPELDFDEYSFNLESAGLPPRAWQASRLDGIFKAPATFALQFWWGAESDFKAAFETAEGMVEGNLVHNWLRAALGESGQGGALPKSKQMLDRLGRCEQFEREKLAVVFGGALPGWWDGLLRKCLYDARLCAKSLMSVAFEGACFFSEKELGEVTVPTPLGELALTGRFDIVLLDRAEGEAGPRVDVFDFKTGKAPSGLSLEKAERGDGLQFWAYEAMARAHFKPAQLRIGVISLGDAKNDLTGGMGGEEIERALAPCAYRQTRNVFGIGLSPDRHVKYGRESLPLATTSIDPGVLLRKSERLREKIAALRAAPSRL